MSSWQRKLSEVIASRNLKTQSNIAAVLFDAGFEVNQATISRELRRTGVRKVDGVYCLAKVLSDIPAVSVSVKTGQCMAVIKTKPAFASVLAHRIDRAGIGGVLGSISGHDTVFVALSGPEAAENLRDSLGLA
jgi:transcriptional regulator of arginine metabolism